MVHVLIHLQLDLLKSALGGIETRVRRRDIPGHQELKSALGGIETKKHKNNILLKQHVKISPWRD